MQLECFANIDEYHQQNETGFQMRTIDEWRLPWDNLGVPAPEELYRRLIASWSEPHRHYHTVQHLGECLEKFSHVRSHACSPDEIALAIWFHDAVYDPKRGDNELNSADWARSAILDAGLPHAVAERVHAMILATRHDQVPEASDAKILVDVDLSILGAPPSRFEEYERQVREEYAWVPEVVFRHERIKIVSAFFHRLPLFQTEYFRHYYEERARENLRQSLARLCGRDVHASQLADSHLPPNDFP